MHKLYYFPCLTRLDVLTIVNMKTQMRVLLVMRGFTQKDETRKKVKLHVHINKANFMDLSGLRLSSRPQANVSSLD